MNWMRTGFILATITGYPRILQDVHAEYWLQKLEGIPYMLEKMQIWINDICRRLCNKWAFTRGVRTCRLWRRIHLFICAFLPQPLDSVNSAVKRRTCRHRLHQKERCSCRRVHVSISVHNWELQIIDGIPRLVMALSLDTHCRSLLAWQWQSCRFLRQIFIGLTFAFAILIARSLVNKNSLFLTIIHRQQSIICKCLRLSIFK